MNERNVPRHRLALLLHRVTNLGLELQANADPAQDDITFELCDHILLLKILLEDLVRGTVRADHDTSCQDLSDSIDLLVGVITDPWLDEIRRQVAAIGLATAIQQLVGGLEPTRLRAAEVAIDFADRLWALPDP